MKFAPALIRGRLIQRYKRFLADVALDEGGTVTATCPNTGSMMGLADPGLAVWLSTSDSPTRKYRHTLEMVEVGPASRPVYVGINTGHPNGLVADAIAAGRLAPLSGFAQLRREVKYGQSSRIDLLLEDPGRGKLYVEIKNVHLSRAKGVAEFPDSRTERGVKHLEELARMVGEGHRAAMVYLIQRRDAREFRLARDIDPDYAAALERARAAGVEAYAWRCRVAPGGISVDAPVAIAL